MENQRWLKQAWTISKIELRRAFFSKRAFWVYGLALFPAFIFFAHNLQIKYKRVTLASAGHATPAQIDSIRTGEKVEDILARLGKTSADVQWQNTMRVRNIKDDTGITTHTIQPVETARFVRLNIIAPNSINDRTARIYEFEVYGDNDSLNLALNQPATGSVPCSVDEGPEKAFNGSVKGGIKDRWCSREWGQRFLQVDLGKPYPIKKLIIKHAGAGGENEELNTLLFNVQASMDDKQFITIVNRTGTRIVEDISTKRRLTYFDGKREARLTFTDGKLETKSVNLLLDFEGDRQIYAGVFQYFYLRLAIFFGCLGIFMNLFRGEMLDKTLHFWFLAPSRREVLLAGKYAAGLISSSVIFAGGALLSFAAMLLIHSSAEVHAYWQNAGMMHAFWYAAASVLGCIGYGSVFVAAGLLLRNPIIPAAILLSWESINGFLPALLQKLSVLYYLQSLCPIPPPADETMPALLRLLLVPAAPTSRTGAIIGLLVLTAVVLWIASIAIRRMQISYGSDT
jgi:hypothetical protein